jgi:hypothetical protein
LLACGGMKILWIFLKKLKIELPYDLAIKMLVIYPNEISTLQRHLLDKALWGTHVILVTWEAKRIRLHLRLFWAKKVARLFLKKQTGIDGVYL